MLKSYSSDIQNFFYIFPLFNLKPTTHVYRCNSLSIFKLFSVFEVLWVNLLCPHRFESCQSCFYFLVDDWIGIAGRFSDDWMIMELFLISISILMHSLFPMIFELLDMHRAIHSKINMSFYCKFIVWSPDNRLWWWLCEHVLYECRISISVDDLGVFQYEMEMAMWLFGMSRNCVVSVYAHQNLVVQVSIFTICLCYWCNFVTWNFINSVCWVVMIHGLTLNCCRKFQISSQSVETWIHVLVIVRRKTLYTFFLLEV